MDQRAKKSAWNPWDSLWPANPKSCPEDSLPIPNLRMERSFPCSLLGFSPEFGIYQPEQQENSNKTQEVWKTGNIFMEVFGFVTLPRRNSEGERSLWQQLEAWVRLFLLHFQRQNSFPKFPGGHREQLQLKGFTSFIAA